MSNGSSIQFSFVGFAIAVVAIVSGAAAGLSLLPVAGSYIGILLGGFVAGLAIEDRPLLESGVAAVLATLGIVMAGPFIGNGIGAAVSALGAIAPATLLVSIVLSFAVGVFGAHFGDDLRAGLTEPIEEPSSGTGGSTGPIQSTVESSTSRPVENRPDSEPVDNESTVGESATTGGVDESATTGGVDEPISSESVGEKTDSTESAKDTELERT